MSYEITNAEASKFESVVTHVMQQVESKLRDKAQVKRWQGAKQLFMNYLGTIEPQLVTDMFAETPPQNINHLKRQISTLPYSMKLWLDMFEDLSVVTDFASPYAEAQRRGANRFFDSLLIAAARGTAYETLDDGITLSAVTLPSGQKVAHGGTNLTIAKLIAANEIFIEGKVPAELPKYMPLGPKQVTSLLQEVEYISTDYNGELAPLKSGQPAPFMGITFIPYDSSMTYAAASVRYLPIWVAPAMGLGISLDFTTKADVLPERNHTRQFVSYFKVGGSRLEEAGVVEVACYEA